jgi:hypothetical protein
MNAWIVRPFTVGEKIIEGKDVEAKTERLGL